jgi:hypothetical protein
MGICRQLAAANLSYRLALGSDDIVDHPLSAGDIQRTAPLLIVEPNDFSARDQALLATVEPAHRLDSVEAALTGIAPAVRLEKPAPVRLLPRVKPGAAVIHLLNWAYDATGDRVEPIRALRLRVDLAALNLRGATRATLFAPGQASQRLQMTDGTLTVPELGFWAVVEIRKPE